MSAPNYTVQIPEKLKKDIRVKEQLGETVILITEKPATEADPLGVEYLHISESIVQITGYRADELHETGLRELLPDQWKPRHETLMLRELHSIVERGPETRIMGGSGESVRTVSFNKKNGSIGSLILPLYGSLIDGKPYLLGIINEVGSPSKIDDRPLTEIDSMVSYGRGDYERNQFPKELNRLLQELRINSWLDTNDIPLAASDFHEVITDAIAKASTIIFLAAPYSVCSPYCAKELRLAREMGKQIFVIVMKMHGTVELSQASWNYLYPEDTEGYKKALTQNRHVQSISTEGLLKQYQPSLASSNWLIWDDAKGFPAYIPQIVKVIEKDKELKQLHTKFLLKAIEWEKNGRSAQFLLTQEEIDEAKKWLKDPGPNRIISKIAQYISDSDQIRSGNYADVFICHDLGSSLREEQIRFSLQARGLSVWNNQNIFDGEDLSIQDRKYNGITRSANILFLVSTKSITDDFCQAQIAYAHKQNKPIYLLAIMPGIKIELPDYLQPHPLVDLTNEAESAAINRLCFEFLKDALDHKQVMARLAAEAKKNWNETTKIPLSPEQLSTAIAYVKRGKYSRKYPPSPLVDQMLSFSLEEKKPFLLRIVPWVAGSALLTGIISGAIFWLRPLPIPEGLAEIREWDFSLRKIQNETGVRRDRIFQCAKELKDALPLPGVADLQPISTMYAFAYEYDNEAQIVGRTVVCQATGVDITRGIPRWVFNVSMDDPIYKRQLDAHQGNPRAGQDSQCFAAFDVNEKNRQVAESLATELEALDVVVVGAKNPEEMEGTLFNRVMIRSEFGLIVSCGAQTVGSPIERKLGSYVSAAIQSEHLRSVDASIILSIVRDKANGNRTALQLDPPVEVLEYAEDHEFRIALFIKASAAGGIINDPVQARWVQIIEHLAIEYNSVIELYDLPCQKCHLDQIIDLEHIATSSHPPDGIMIAASNSLLIGAALKDLYDKEDIPIVAFDTEVDVNNGILLSYIGPDNRTLAYKVAKWAVDEIGAGQAIIVNGPLIQKNARDREAGFLQAIAESPLIENVGSGTGNWGEESGYNLALNMLGAFPDLRLFLCANDRMALGVARAARELGRRQQVIITGFDYIDTDVTTLIDATISQGSDKQVKTATRILFEYLRKGTEPLNDKIIYDHFEVILPAKNPLSGF